MTKEEEAINSLEKLINIRKNKAGQIKYDNCICSTTDLETVLNMLKDKDAEIEILKRDFKIVDQECSRLERKEAKQDKMIDLILEFLSERDLGYYTKEEGGEVLGIMRKYNKEDWKQYFEGKAINDG